MGRGRTKDRGQVQDAFRDPPQEDYIVRETVNPRDARRIFEQTPDNYQSSPPRATSPTTIEAARQKYLEQTASPAPVSVPGKNRKSLKKRKKFGKGSGRKSPSVSSVSSSSDSDDISWDDLIDSRYTPLIIDLADWMGFITGRKVLWEKFFEKIWSGVLLCDFCNSMNKLCPDPKLPKISMESHTDKGKTFIRYNVEVYLLWCRGFGVPQLSLMDVSDLVDKKSVKMVLGTLLAVGREARARALPCPVVAVLEQTYKMNYESLIDAVVDDDAIDDSKRIHDSVKLKRKRFQMIKSKAQSGADLRQGMLDANTKNIQEDILCLMYLKGFKKGDNSAENVIKGWQGAVRSGDYRAATLPSNIKGALERFESVEMRYGQTLPRNYGGTKPEDDEEEDNRDIGEELRNFKTPDLPKQEPEVDPKKEKPRDRRISFGFGIGDIFGSKDGKNKDVVPKEPAAEEQQPTLTQDQDKTEDNPEYVLTIPGEQFGQMQESGILGEMLDSYQITEEGEYNVTLTSLQYREFQNILNHDKIETTSQAQDGYYIVLFTPEQWEQIHHYKEVRSLELSYEQSSDHDKFIVKMSEPKYDRYLEIQTAINDLAEQKVKKKKKSKRRSSKRRDSEDLESSPATTPKVKRKSRLGRWGSKSSIKPDTSESEGERKRKKSFSFTKKRRDSSADENGERKRKSSLFGRGKKKSAPPPEPEPAPVVEPEPVEFGVWPNIQTRLGEVDDPSLSLPNSSEDHRNLVQDPKSRIPPHLAQREPEPEPQPERLFQKYTFEPEVLKPDYKEAPEDYQTGNISPDEGTDVSEYSVVSYPIIGKRKRKKRKKRRSALPGGGTYSSEVGCLECFVMVFCPWRWVSSR